MIRKLLRDAALSLLIGCTVSLLVYTTLGDVLAESPADAVSGWSRARVVSKRVMALDATVATALGEMDLQPKNLVEWNLDHPESNLRKLWQMKPLDQKNASVIALYILHQNRGIDPKTAWREAVSFVHYSNKYDVPLTLSVAVANAESHFNPDARSSHGAIGVMQVVWRIHTNLLRAHGINSQEDLQDPEKGIAAGILLLSRYLKAYGSTQRALGRYYGGPVESYWPKIARNMARVASYGIEPEL
ncbi:MAG: transglycosylase SLT domain-containing protein [Thermovirgaceae bacterium]|nr:transglycosylase SLT domain-containing protein [Thermovirgaceae bacterium]